MAFSTRSFDVQMKLYQMKIVLVLVEIFEWFLGPADCATLWVILVLAEIDGHSFGFCTE